MEDATNEPFLTKSNVRACGESGKPASNRRKKPSQTREGVESPMDTGVQDAPDPGTSRHIQCRKTQCFPRSRAGSTPVGDAIMVVAKFAHLRAVEHEYGVQSRQRALCSRRPFLLFLARVMQLQPGPGPVHRHQLPGAGKGNIRRAQIWAAKTNVRCKRIARRNELH